MLRYLRCVQKMKRIIEENGLTVMATNALYVSGPAVLWEVFKYRPCSLCTYASRLVRTRRSLSLLGGTKASTWVLLLSKEPISAIYHAISEATSTWTRCRESRDGTGAVDCLMPSQGEVC